MNYDFSTLELFPHLFYDTAIPGEAFAENKPYRNIGDLLVKRSLRNREALRLCGAAPAVTEGLASDFECFSALCTATPMLSGHSSARETKELLRRVFGLEAALSPYEVEELWGTLNQAIEEAVLRPSDLLQALNIEAVCYRHSPYDPLPETDFPDVDLYPIFDLGHAPESVLFDPRNSAMGFEDTMRILTERLGDFLAAGCVSVRLFLPENYFFSRNSKKKEIEDFCCNGKAGVPLSAGEKNQLITALFIHMAAIVKKSGLTLLLETEASENELIRLYDYLSLNGIVLETLLINSRPASYRRFILRHIFRTEKGLPGILPVSVNLSSFSDAFPVGSALLPSGNVCDILSLSEGYIQRRKLIALLSEIGISEGIDPDTISSLAEDITYGNIKNRFGI